MCGIVGILSTPTSSLHQVVDGMSGKISHRGPDAAGAWINEAGTVGLGHRRLSIIDLSPAGAQPMHSACGRYVLVFNGEIYNFQALKGEISRLHPGQPWRGRSDTEVVLAAITHWGVDTTLTKLDGMFALAVFDKHSEELYLARDRMGEKPLYFGYVGDQFTFSSELKALRSLPGWTSRINRTALTAYFRYSYIPSPLSIYEGVSKLLPGHWLKLSPSDFLSRKIPASTSFWQLDDAIAIGRLHPYTGSEEDATNDLESLLMETIQKQMVSDVPIGAFLSGGVDSSTVVAMMQAQSEKPIETFTVGFVDTDFNEASHAKAVAQHLGTSHNELYVSPTDSLSIVPDLPRLYDEPFADSSQIPTYLISKLARTKVTVSLSGDGGDELFCGYNRYTWMYKIWGAMSPFPSVARNALGRIAAAIPPPAIDSVYGLLYPVLPHWLQFSNASDKWTKVTGLIGETDSGALYKRIVSSWQDPSGLVLGGNEPLSIFELSEPQSHKLDLGEQMMRFDALTYLPDDILVKVDRASMGVSLEARVPLLDRRIVEFAWHLPMSMKLRNGVSKWILREVLYRHVPQSLIERPKMGFGVPIDRWLRVELRDWAEELLDAQKMREQGYLNVELVRKAWDEHQSGRRNWQYQIWTVLMFQAWLKDQSDINGSTTHDRH
ncbi:MAG: asparagine synthase (glutamine-hydrolyzing) [Betaproteobacteria bacterium]|nr:asparagine synthase (glutamine-hydrolyzing) [Betaproteobacteria bacterium]